MKLGEMRDAAEALDGQGLIEVAVDEEQDPAEALGIGGAASGCHGAWK